MITQKNSIIISAFTFFFVLVACDNSLEDDKRYAEEKSIESYITSKNWKHTKKNGVYHVARVPSYNYEVNSGDTVEFWYKAYTPTSTALVFDTNIKTEAITAKLDTNVRDFKPMRVIAGKTDLVEGLKRGLLLTRLNEESTLIFTSDIGFKDQIIGPLPAWSSVAYDIQIIYLNGSGIESEKQIMAGLNTSDYDLHTSGLYFKKIIEGNTTLPTTTQIIYGWYKCSLTDGTIVEEISSDNIEIDLTSTEITDALRLGFTLTGVGGTTNLIAASPLGYGKKGIGIVEPYQPLLYTIRLDSIK